MRDGELRLSSGRDPSSSLRHRAKARRMGWSKTYYSVYDVSLNLMRGLQFLESVLSPVEAEGSLLLHEAQLSLDVRGLLSIGEGVPARLSAPLSVGVIFLTPHNIPCSSLRLTGASCAVGWRVLGGRNSDSGEEEHEVGEHDDVCLFLCYPEG